MLEQPKQLSSHPGANMRWKRIALFLARYPQLYHVSLCSDSETVLRLGLLSAASVLDSVGASASLRKTLQQSQRKSVIHVSHPVHGALFLNDQLPLPASALVRCLIGITPAQWYEELNQRIFFWLSRSQAERFAAVRKTLLPPKTLFVLVLENPDGFAIRLTEQISSIGLFAVTESQCAEDEHDDEDEDDSKFRNLG